jgi:hypothetical protein
MKPPTIRYAEYTLVNCERAQPNSRSSGSRNTA